MQYLTAAEISAQWNISSRMAAYYCEAGRIDGAIKKGKVWLIPADAQKPVDKRCSKHKTKNPDKMQGKPYTQDGLDNDTLYRTGDVSDNLGLTRETLRYYEEIGLIRPKRSKYSQYREFDLFDMSRLMAIDFFRKRGFSTAEIRELQKASTPEKYSEAMQEKISFLQKEIEYRREMLAKLQKTQNFYNRAADSSLEFTVRELPLCYVQETIGSVDAFSEYRDKILSHLNPEKDDIFSNIARFITFDENGYKTSGIHIVKPVTAAEQIRQETLLECGKCLYTTLIADSDDSSIPKKMFPLCYEWAKRHNVSFRGVVYIFNQFIMLNEQMDKHYYEVWVPLQD